MVSPKMIAASLLAIATTCGVAMAQSAVPPGRVFAFHLRRPGNAPHSIGT